MKNGAIVPPSFATNSKCGNSKEYDKIQKKIPTETKNGNKKVGRNMEDQMALEYKRKRIIWTLKETEEDHCEQRNLEPLKKGNESGWRL